VSNPIFLRLAVLPDTLAITVGNRGEMAQRIWARTNSWGWSMFSLLVAPHEEPWQELTAKPVRWTRNAPHALELPPGGELLYELRPGDPDWQGLDTLGGWLELPLQVQSRLRIPETPEAVEHAVFLGEALSPPALSQPPHRWLVR
jgi:hypothetical protein